MLNDHNLKKNIYIQVGETYGEVEDVYYLYTYRIINL